KMTTFDDVLEQVGKFGAFQKRIFVLACLMSLPFCIVYVGIVFLGFTPDHWCRSPGAAEMREKCGWSREEEKNYTVPLLEHFDGSKSFSHCERYAVDWNSTAISCEDPLILFRNHSDNTMPLTSCQDGWEFENTIGTSFVIEFNLVCSDAWKLDLSQSVLNFGFLLGSISMGYLSDRFGRKMVFMIGLLTTFLFGVLTAFAQSYPWFVLFRSLQGLFGRGGWMSVYVLLSEIVGSEYRRTVGILYQMAFSIGILILPVVAYFVHHWRWLQLAFTVPFFLFLFNYWFIPESPRWLISHRQSAKAMAISKKIAKQNGRKLSIDFETLKPEDEDSTMNNPSVFDLVRTPQMRKHTFILMFNWFSISAVYQGLIMRLGILGGNIYFDFFISGLVEFPSAFLILLTIERVGRRLPFAISTIVAGASCLIVAFIPEALHWLKTTISLVGRCGITMAFELVCLVNTELYPTFLRNFGVSVCSAFCDIGGIVAPFILYRLAAIWLELPVILFGVIGLLSGGSVLLLPETKGMPLPETIEEIESGHRYSKQNRLVKDELFFNPVFNSSVTCS
uniref:Solute carrier family 22 member 3 n=1 Tax=Latimeria chalumnae TaxID=7897 RepID=H3ABZ4_LATCH